MIKSKEQSKQAPFLHHYKHKLFTLFQHQSTLFERTPKDENQQRPEI
jgi:hypothetical protein